MKNLARLGFVLIAAIALAMPAAAHNRIPQVLPSIDLRGQVDAQDRVQPLRVLSNDRTFDDVAHVDLPAPSIARELARRFVLADVDERRELHVFAIGVKEKLASGPLGLFEENNVNERRELGLESRSGCVYVRNRWYDPMTGSFLTPDPLGYTDSSNLYAFAGGDPVNHRDPSGMKCLGMGGTVTCDDIWWGVKSLVSSKQELKKTAARTAASYVGFHAGVLKTVASANPISMAVSQAKESASVLGSAIGAYQAGGVAGLKEFAKEEDKRQKEAALDALPFVGTARSFNRAIDEYEKGNNFAGGMAIGETSVRAYGDPTLVYGAHQLLAPGPILQLNLPKAAPPPLVIGEGMQDRVIPFARENGYEWYRGAPELPEDAWMEHNREYIRNRKAEGRPVIDIGPHPGRGSYPNPTSDYYGMEREEMNGYDGYVEQPLSEPERLQVTSGNYH